MRSVFSLARGLRLVAGLAVLCGALGPLSARADASATPGRALLDRALHDATTSRWVHESVQVKQKGVVVEDALDDIGATEGIQYVSELGGAASEVIAFDQRQILYVRSNVAGLTTIYQLSATDAATYTNQWLTVTPSDAEYSSIAYATDLTSDFGQVRFAGAVTESGVLRVEGRRVRALSGVVPPIDGAPRFDGTLYVTATGRALPVVFDEKNARASVSVSWADWGHRYVLHAPTSTAVFPTS
jgi:hypothetical protein